MTAEEKALIADLVQFGLDLGGIADPTPTTDVVSTLDSWIWRRDFWGGVMTLGGVLPGLGDLGKLGKVGRYIQSAQKAIDLVVSKPAGAFARVARPLLGKIEAGLDRLPLDRLPQNFAQHLDEFRDRLRAGVHAPSNAGVHGSSRPLPARIGGTDDIPRFRNFNDAQVNALDWLRGKGFDPSRAQPSTSKFTGQTYGMKMEGNVGFRIEYDARNGAHINVFAGKEKGPHFVFPGNEEAVNAILRQLFGG